VDIKDLQRLYETRGNALDHTDSVSRLLEESHEAIRLLGRVGDSDYLSEAVEAVKALEKLQQSGLGSHADAFSQLSRGFALETSPVIPAIALEKIFEEQRSALTVLGAMSTGHDLYASVHELAQKSIGEIVGSAPGMGQLWQLEDNRWRSALEGIGNLDYSAVGAIARDTAASFITSLDSVVERLNETTLLAGHSVFNDLLLTTSIDHSHFAAETLSQISRAGNIESNALRASLVLFNDQAARGSAALYPFIGRPYEASATDSGEEPEVDLTPEKFSVPRLQREELLQRGEDVPAEGDYNDFAALAPTSAVADDSIACILLIERCNETSMVKGRTPVFKPTTKCIVAAAQLPRVAARDRESFAVFVDYLYFLIYEATGAAKRIREGDLMRDEECVALWDIKNLRSKFLRHDVEHGSEREIMKKYGDVGAAFERLGLPRLPGSADDYARLQIALLGSLKSFLTELAGRIEVGGNAGH
jgi:hypothetical protein